MTDKEQLELEEKQLEIEERKENLRLRKLEGDRMQREAKQYELKDADRTAELQGRSKALESQRPENRFAAIQQRCNHLQGGWSLQALRSGTGDGDESTVFKVRLVTGDVMLRCQRCRGTWVQPYEPEFYFDKNGSYLAKEKGGKFDHKAYKRAVDEYNQIYNMRSKSWIMEMPQFMWLRDGKPVNKEITRAYLRGLGVKPASAYVEKEIE